MQRNEEKHVSQEEMQLGGMGWGKRRISPYPQEFAEKKEKLHLRN